MASWSSFHLMETPQLLGNATQMQQILLAVFLFSLCLFYSALFISIRLVPIYTAPVHLHGTGTRETNKSKLQPPPGMPQVAHPNDRAMSIRPAKRDENVRLGLHEICI